MYLSIPGGIKKTEKLRKRKYIHILFLSIPPYLKSVKFWQKFYKWQSTQFSLLNFAKAFTEKLLNSYFLGNIFCMEKNGNFYISSHIISSITKKWAFKSSTFYSGTREHISWWKRTETENSLKYYFLNKSVRKVTSLGCLSFLQSRAKCSGMDSLTTPKRLRLDSGFIRARHEEVGLSLAWQRVSHVGGTPQKSTENNLPGCWLLVNNHLQEEMKERKDLTTRSLTPSSSKVSGILWSLRMSCNKSQGIIPLSNVPFSAQIGRWGGW